MVQGGWLDPVRYELLKYCHALEGDPQTQRGHTDTCFSHQSVQLQLVLVCTYGTYIPIWSYLHSGLKLDGLKWVHFLYL